MKTLPTYFLLPVLSLLLLSKSHGQDRKVEIQLYYGPFSYLEAEVDVDTPTEYGGPSLEYYIKENISIGLSASVNRSTNDILDQVRHPVSDNLISHDYSIEKKNKILNFYFRKYSERGPKMKIFMGGYLRYWYHSNDRIETDLYSQEYLEYLIDAKDPDNLIDHKFSIGFLAGIKAELSERAYLSVTGGFGGSLPFMYFRSEKHFNEADNRMVSFKTADEFDTRHLSLLSHISVGFRF